MSWMDHYNQGVAAREAGQPFTSCPYAPWLESCVAWRMGWKGET